MDHLVPGSRAISLQPHVASHRAGGKTQRAPDSAPRSRLCLLDFGPICVLLARRDPIVQADGRLRDSFWTDCVSSRILFG